MTAEQKKQIESMRLDGYGYKMIAQILGIPDNTVKSYCRRKKLTGNIEAKAEVSAPDGVHRCRCCGKEVPQTKGRKEKKFCSDKCRNRWWNSHLSDVEKKANYDYICPHCKKSFTVYGNARRKYCCHPCYIADRFGGEA